jgi:hypothetical protein
MTVQADLIRDKRRHFATPGGFHDKLISFLAKALPAAIGLVAAVMILSPLSPRGESGSCSIATRSPSPTSASRSTRRLTVAVMRKGAHLSSPLEARCRPLPIRQW